MFENIGNIIFLGVLVGVVIIIVSLVEYKRKRDKAGSLILSSIGLGILGLSLVAHYIIMNDASNMSLILGVPDMFFAVLFGLKGIYELGTGKPRTFLSANQEIHIIGSVASKYYREDCYCFKAVTGSVEDLSEVPIMYAIPTTKFSKVPSENSTFETDKNGKIKQDTIKGKTKRDIIK